MGRVGLDRAAGEGLRSIKTTSPELTDAIRTTLATLRPDFDEDQRAAITTVIRHLVSFDGFHRLTHEFGLSPKVAGEVTAWAFTVLRDALEDGGGPGDF